MTANRSGKTKTAAAAVARQKMLLLLAHAVMLVLLVASNMESFFLLVNAEWEFRLNPKNSEYVGRFELRPSPTHPWGTICDDESTNWNALVICKTVGFTGINKAKLISRWGESYLPLWNGTKDRKYTEDFPIYMDDVACPTEANSILDCFWNSRHDCDHDEDVGVDCTPIPEQPWEFMLVNQSKPGIGILKARPNSSAVWGTVAVRGFTMWAATVACRTLGYNVDHALYEDMYGAIRWTWFGNRYGINTSYIPINFFHSEHLPIWMQDVQCPENAQTLRDCTWSDCPHGTSRQCYHYEDTIIDCTTLTEKWQFKLVDKDGPDRGRIMVKLNSSTGWGTMCNAWGYYGNFLVFQPNLVRDLCWELGYRGEDSIPLPWYGYGRPFSETIPIHMFHYTVDNFLRNSSHGYMPHFLFWSDNHESYYGDPWNCNHSMDVGIQCSNMTRQTAQVVEKVSSETIGECTDATQCDLWILAAHNKYPKDCPYNITVTNSGAGTVSATTCRDTAKELALGVGNQTGIPALPSLIFPESRLWCIAFACNISMIRNIDTSVNMTTLQSWTIPQKDPAAIPFNDPLVELWAPLKEEDTTGLCNRERSCSSHGDVSVVLEDYHLPPVYQCTCHCDPGYEGTGCQIKSTMSTVFRKIEVYYRAIEAMNSITQDYIGRNVTSLINNSLVTVEGGTPWALPHEYHHNPEWNRPKDPNVLHQFTVQFNIISADDVQTSRVTNLLLQRAYMKKFIEIVEYYGSATKLQVLEVTNPTAVENNQHAVEKMVIATNTSGEYILSEPVYISLTDDLPLNLKKDVEVFRAGKFEIYGVRPNVTGATSFTIDIRISSTRNCSCTLISTLAVEGDEAGFCGDKLSCDIVCGLPFPVLHGLQVTLPAPLNVTGCNNEFLTSWSRHRAPSSNVWEQSSTVVIKVNITGGQQVQSSYLTSGTVLKAESSISLDAVVLYLMGVSTVIVMIAATLFTILRLFQYGDSPLWIFALVLFLGSMFMMSWFAFNSASDTPRSMSSMPMLIVDEYRGQLCDQSPSSFAPHRVTMVSDDQKCQPTASFGSVESVYWMRSMCAVLPGSQYNEAQIKVAFGQAQKECESAPWMTIDPRVCHDEADFMPKKPQYELQFVRFVCATGESAQERKTLLNAKLEHLVAPNEDTKVLPLAPSDYWFQGNRLVFHIGSWTSDHGVFQPLSESSEALGTFSVADIVNGKPGSSNRMDNVTYEGQIPRYYDISRREATLPPPASFNVSPMAAYAVSGLNLATMNPVLGISSMAAQGMLFNGHADVPTTGNLHGTRALRYQGVKDSEFDIGRFDEDGFTITFWVRASVESRGFVFLVTDNWVEAESGSTPLAERLSHVLNDVDRDFYEGWPVYSAIYMDGASKAIQFYSYNNRARGSDKSTINLVWNNKAVQDIFDDDWHFIALIKGPFDGSAAMQLMVDGQTSTVDRSFKQCIPKNSEIPTIHSHVGETVKVHSKSKQVVFDGGVAYVGHLNAGVFGFSIHEGVLEPQRIIALGVASMNKESDSRGLAIFFFSLACFAAILIGWQRFAAYQRHVQEEKEMLQEEKKEHFKRLSMSSPRGQRASKMGLLFPRKEGANAEEERAVEIATGLVDDEDEEMEEQKADEQTAVVPFDDPADHGIRMEESVEIAVAPINEIAVAPINTEVVADVADPDYDREIEERMKDGHWKKRLKILVIIPIFINVAQNMGLYMSAWTWPISFQWSWDIWFVFLFDFEAIFPTVPPWIFHVIIYFFALITIVFMLTMAHHENVLFRDAVIEHIHEEELDDRPDETPMAHLPDPSVIIMPGGAPMNYSVNGREVVGWCSRENLQMAVARELHSGEGGPGQGMKLGALPASSRKHGGAPQQHPHDEVTVLWLKGTVEALHIASPNPDVPNYVYHFYQKVIAEANISMQTLDLMRYLGFPYLDMTQLIPIYSKLQFAGAVVTVDNSTDVASYSESGGGGNDSIPGFPAGAMPILPPTPSSVRSSTVNSSELTKTQSFMTQDVEITRMEHLGKLFDFVKRYYHFALDVLPSARETMRRALRMRKAQHMQTVFEEAEVIEGNDPNKKEEMKEWIYGEQHRDFNAEQLKEAQPIWERAERGFVDGEVSDTLRTIYEEAMAMKLDPEHFRTFLDIWLLYIPSTERQVACRVVHLINSEDIGKFTKDTIVELLSSKSVHSRFRWLETASIHIGNVTVAKKKNASSAPAATATATTTTTTMTIEATEDNKNKKEEEAVEILFKPRQFPSRATSEQEETWAVDVQSDFVMCPIHLRRMVERVENGHGEIRRRNPDAYPCALQNNEVYEVICKHNTLQSTQEKPTTCANAKTFYCCPDDSCGFSICSNCWQVEPTFWGKFVPKLARRWYVVRKRGLMSFIGLLIVVLGEWMYLPALRTSIRTIFCHVSLACQWPTCYSPATPGFMAMAILSALVIIFMGIGMVAFLSISVYRRKKMLIDSGVMNQYISVGGKAWNDDPNREATFWNVIRAECGLDIWSAITELDHSMLRSLYMHYEFSHMWMHPSTFVFKAIVVVIVLYASDTNSLGVVVAVAFVELVQVIVFISMDPFINPWINLAAKCGPVHQMIQLGLVLWHRSVTVKHPDFTAAAWAMTGVAITYLMLILAVGLVVGYHRLKAL